MVLENNFKLERINFLIQIFMPYMLFDENEKDMYLLKANAPKKAIQALDEYIQLMGNNYNS